MPPRSKVLGNRRKDLYEPDADHFAMMIGWIAECAAHRGVVVCSLPHATLHESVWIEWPNPSILIPALRGPLDDDEGICLVHMCPNLLLCATDGFGEMGDAAELATTIAKHDDRSGLLYVGIEDFDTYYSSLKRAVTEASRHCGQPLLRELRYEWGIAFVRKDIPLPDNFG